MKYALMLPEYNVKKAEKELQDFKDNKINLFTNKEALEEIFEAVPDSYVKFRIWDVHQLEKKKEKNKKKEECR